MARGCDGVPARSRRSRCVTALALRQTASVVSRRPGGATALDGITELCDTHFRRVSLMTTSLNPAQRRALELLGRPAVPPPPAPEGLIARLVTELETGLADLTPHLAGERLHVNKHALARIHACERHYLGTHTEFEWSPRTARGSVVHKAVQLTINWRGEPHPPDLVDEALAILVDGDDGLARWLGGAGEAARAELRSEAVDLVSAFQECFPPLKSSWRPVTETPVRVDLFDGLIRLTGRVDLTLGTPER